MAFPELITIIIGAFNEENTLPQQMAALASQTYRGDWEFIVVDNGSRDGTADVARSWRDRLPALNVIEYPSLGG